MDKYNSVIFINCYTKDKRQQSMNEQIFKKKILYEIN